MKGFSIVPRRGGGRSRDAILRRGRVSGKWAAIVWHGIAGMLGFGMGAGRTMAAESTAPVGFYTLQLQKGEQSVGINLVNPALLTATVGQGIGNRVVLSGPAGDGGKDLVPGRAYYMELVRGPGGTGDPLTGHRLEVQVAETLAATMPDGQLGVDLTSKRTTLANLEGLAGYRVELREHITLNQVFPKLKLFGSTNFADADQVQFFDGSSFEICYVYGRNDGLAQWTGLKQFASQDLRVIAPGAGVIFKRSGKSSGTVQLRVAGVARTTPFVQPLVTGYNFVAGGFAVDSSLTDWRAFPRAYSDGDRIKLFQPGGFVTYRLYSQGAAPEQNIWVLQGDRYFTPVNQQRILSHQGAAFLQLKTGDPLHRYPAPFVP